jgi:hypothetical protein
MKRSRHVDPAVRFSRRRNGLAILISLAALGTLHFNFESAPAGADHEPGKIDVARLTKSVLVTVPVSHGQQAAPIQTASLGESSLSPRELDFNAEANRLSLLLNLSLLEQGHERLSRIPDYTATFVKQERIDGEMKDEQVMELKLRHAPFSVYMKWHAGEVGRELLYHEGENEGKIIVHPGGLRGRLLASIKLEPTNALVMAESRHPVTMVGLLNLSGEIITRRKAEMRDKHDLRCELIDNQVVNDRPCYCFIVTYMNREQQKEYRKSVQFIDKELYLPICVKNYSWPESADPIAPEKLDEETLIEHYVYTDITFNRQFAATDFDRANEEYHFRR